MNWKTSFCSLGIAPPYAESGGPSSNRLARAYLRLEAIERRRAEGRCSLLARWVDRWVEKRIVWRELVELEVQVLRRRGMSG